MVKKIYRVYTNEPTNWGDEKVMIKVFIGKENLDKAKKYFKELVKLTKKDAEETDDTLYVLLEEITEDKQIKYKQLNEQR